MIICGASAYPRDWDYKKLREVGRFDYDRTGRAPSKDVICKDGSPMIEKNQNRTEHLGARLTEGVDRMVG